MAVTIRWTGLLDSRKIPPEDKRTELDCRTPQSLATLPTALQVVQLIQGQLRLQTSKHDRYRCVISVRVPGQAEWKMYGHKRTTDNWVVVFNRQNLVTSLGI